MEFERIADKKRLDFIIHGIREAVPPGGRILDIGCGNGIITRGIGSLGYRITGVDSSAKTIETARSNNRFPNVDFRIVLPGEIASDLSRYDAMICSEVLEHLDRPEELLRDIYKVLKDDGIVVVTVPNGKGPRELLVTRPIQYLQKKDNIVWKAIKKFKSSMGYSGATVQSSADDLRHIQYFTSTSLNRLAENHGFHIVSFAQGNFIEQVFPFSLLFKRSKFLQTLDCSIADRLPRQFSSSFMTVWKKKRV